MTVLFSDVEGFTTLAEQLAPHELTEQTSRYFENVTGAVAEEQGTIDKFIGDSVMAFWGAPAELDDHAFHACRAALRARHRMARLSAEWAATGRKPMRVRIGVHCGDVVVGNVGSPERLSYTVMGDGVNIASRLEGHQQAVRQHDLHQRRHPEAGRRSRGVPAARAVVGAGPQRPLRDPRTAGHRRQRRSRAGRKRR